MTPSQDLFNLIKSLKQTEKRYFKVYASKLSAGKEPEYLQVFNAIESMEVYDEKKLKEKFIGRPLVKQLHVVKNYLTEVILASLVAYHEGNSVANDLLHMLQAIEILYNKALPELCLKQIERGIKICREYSRHDILFLFLGWKARIMIRRLEYIGALEIMAEQKQITEGLNNYVNEKERAIKMHHFIVTKGFPRTEEEKKALRAANAGLLSAQPGPNMSMQQAYYHYIALGKFYAANEENKKRLEPLAQLVSLLEENKKYALENPDIYLSALGDYWLALMDTGQIKPAQAVLFKIRQLAEQLDSKKYDAKNYAFLIFYIFELDTSISANQTHRTVQLVPRIRELIKKVEGAQQKSIMMELIYNTYRVLFIAGRYSEALDWINLILNESMATIREDLRTSAHIFYLIIHYEQGNALLLQNIIGSTQNALKYKRRLFKAEKVLLAYLQKLNKAKTDEDKSGFYRQLYDDFSLVYNDPRERKSTFDEDAWAWINSKLSGRPLAETHAENYRKQISGK